MGFTRDLDITCTMCGDDKVKTFPTDCGHEVVLCLRCKKEYPGITTYCWPCEEAADTGIRETREEVVDDARGSAG